MTTADTNPQANDGCSKEEAERRMMELQMMDLGTQRREFISTVDAPSKYRNVSKEEIEANRRVRADPRIRHLAEENKSKLSAWNSVHETIGDDVEGEDLDNLMDGQSHRARLYDLVRQSGGQSYVEPEPLYNGHSHRPISSHSHGHKNPQQASAESFDKKKKGEAAITNAAGRTRKALPKLGKHTVTEAPTEPRSNTQPSTAPKAVGKKKSKQTVVSQLDPAKNPHLGQNPQSIPTQPRSMNPPLARNPADTKDPSKPANKYGPAKKPVPRPPRPAVGPIKYSPYMADPNDFMKAVEAAMPPDKPLRSPMSPSLPIGSSFTASSAISAPSVASTRSVHSFAAVEDDPNAFMMKAASIVSKPLGSSTRSITSDTIDQQTTPKSIEEPISVYIGGLQVEVVSRSSSPRPEKVQIRDEEDAGQLEEEMPKEETFMPSEPLQTQGQGMPQPQLAESQKADQPEVQEKPAPAPSSSAAENLLDLDFDEAPIDPKPIRPSMPLQTLPFTEPPIQTPAPQSPQSSHSITPKDKRALEAYLRIFVRFRVELRKLMHLAKNASADEEVKEYIKQRKQEVEEDYNILWEELTERYPDIDLDEIEEEVLMRSLKVRIQISETDLDQLRKKAKGPTQRTEPAKIAQSQFVNPSVTGPASVVTTAPTFSDTSDSPLTTGPNVLQSPTTTTASTNDGTTFKSNGVDAKAPIFSPSYFAHITTPSHQSVTSPGNSLTSDKPPSRSSTTASFTPSMASNLFQPSRTTGNVLASKSGTPSFDSLTGQDHSTVPPMQSAPSPIGQSNHIFPPDHPMFTQTPGGLFKPIYQQNVQPGVNSFAPGYGFQGNARLRPVNRLMSPPMSFSGNNTHQRQAQGSTFCLGNPSQPSTQALYLTPALQQSKWAASSAANASRNETPTEQLESFTAKLRTRGITIKPIPQSKSINNSTDNVVSEVSQLSNRLQNTHPFGNGRPNLDPKASLVRSDENKKATPEPTYFFPKPAPKKAIGLTGSKWAL